MLEDGETDWAFFFIFCCVRGLEEHGADAPNQLYQQPMTSPTLIRPA